MTSSPRPYDRFAQAPLLVVIATFLMLQPLSTDLYLASLPGLASVFGVPASTVQLTLSLFVIGFGGAQLVVGPLSDRYGRRPIALGGLALYVLASLLCALSPSIGWLIAARFLQALGCCCAVIMARAIVRDAYLPEHSVRILARASTWLSVAPLFGPILGSYLQVAFGWRAAFVALAAFSSALLALAIVRLPETNDFKDPHATQVRGLLANYRRVLGSRAFWAHALPGALSYGAIFSFISGSSLVLIDVLKVPTEWFGYCFAFGVSGYMGGTLLCRRLIGIAGPSRTLAIGSSVSLLSGVAFLLAASAGVSHWSLVLAAMFFTMGAHGINFPVAQAGAVSPFAQQAGTAAGLMGALYMSVAFAVGTVVAGTYNGTLVPLSVIVCTIGVLIFGSARLLADKKPKTQP